MKALSHSFARIRAIFMKEMVQMRRDRLTFAIMLAVPIIQLVLFGYAINTDPRHMPTAVVAEEQSPEIRSILKGLELSDYFRLTEQAADAEEATEMLVSGKVNFVVSFPAGFTERLLRGDRPQMLVEADASDPVAASVALAQAGNIVNHAMSHDLKGPLASLQGKAGPVDVVVQARFNPEAVTQYNIVPGLLGVILTMTLVMITSMAMTRETERGTMENLLAMPARPLEVLVGKITPYIVVGAIQATLILVAGRLLFGVPFVGSFWVLLAGVSLFVIANLALGFTFSTVARSQMQAMQLTFFFFLPSILLSGFMFPFRGMPDWAQAIGQVLPLTHFLRIVRGVMLKGAGLAEIRFDLLAILAFTLVVGLIAFLRYRRTLD
ncbi:MAG: ABC transporter permease [Hyphomonadaceae bacterium]